MAKKVTKRKVEEFFSAMPYSEQQPIQSRMIKRIQASKEYPVMSQANRTKFRDRLMMDEVGPLILAAEN